MSGRIDLIGSLCWNRNSMALAAMKRCSGSYAIELRQMRSLALSIALAAVVSAAEAYERPPFEKWFGVDGVTLSNDRYGIWFSINATAFRSRLPEHGRVVSERDKGQYVMLRITCRADGSLTGGPGKPVESVLFVPLHPEQKDAYGLWLNPIMYFWRGLRGQEFAETPVQVRIGEQERINAKLVRQTISYSIPRPDQQIVLRPETVVQATKAADPAMRIAAQGEKTLIDSTFRLDRQSRRVIASMAETCRM